MKTTPRKIYNKEAFVEKIKEKLPESEFLSRLVRNFSSGEKILEEASENNILFVILQGVVSQAKQGDSNRTKIDLQGPGDFIGLLSFQTGEPVFTSSKAHTDAKLLAIDHTTFDQLTEKYPDISNTLQGLIFLNLADRYRRVVGLHVQVDMLSLELKKEKAQLKKIIEELEHTRNMLISQEKMAVLGELTAGLAHEMNNPVSSLLRSVDYLLNYLPQMLEQAAVFSNSGQVRYFFECGRRRFSFDSVSQRQRAREISRVFPHLKRSQLRVMAEMDDQAYKKIKELALDKKQEESFNMFIEAFQAGVFLNGIRLSAGRIEYLVKSLKSFSRQNATEQELIDIRPGIKETLQILRNFLKNINLELDLQEIPPIPVFPGEINQVWTNIIINAVDAMQGRGDLFVSCGFVEQSYVWVKIGDSGPGVPDKVKNKIFESSFTTKTAGGEFGLGLGLAISKGIVEKHQGHIEVVDRKGGGAEFIVKLPSENSKVKLD